MKRTEFGFVVVDKTSLEAGVLVVMHFLPLQEDPSPKAAKEYLETLMIDDQFKKLVKDTKSVPFVMPTMGLLCDLFDEMVADQDPTVVPAIQQPKSKIIMPGDIGKPYDQSVPQSAEAILLSLRNQGHSVVL